MGCVSSKQAVSVTPVVDIRPESAESGSGRLGELEQKRKLDLGEFGTGDCNGGQSLSFRLGNLQRVHGVGGGEHVVGAGWPVWLTAVAGEAIRGWVPLRTDKFEKLEKIGQGTYSSVFRARNLDTGKIVALKKVRFDNFEPESVRFMAREIMILRRLDHPNIIKLEGIITSRLSCSIYLVFEYMEHDLSGLLACPDIQFSESQVKCYMKQLLSGLEHCHSRGVMHRDIKGSNLLINNEGILKIADFGLANFSSSRYKQPLTSRVVTLWYRPPELLLGSTEYGASVDLWSVGCVFAECYLGRPILPGRTEVEQLHKIFKLCGSPPDEFWKKSKLPHSTLSKPTQPYESCLRDTFKHLPITALSLIETLLSVEPYKRGTAFYALSSEYFKTKPYACDPSSLPKYPPNKEIDAKNRDDARRKKTNVRSRGEPTKKRNGISKLAPAEDFPPPTKVALKLINNNVHIVKEVDIIPKERKTKSSIGVLEDVSHVKHASQGDIPFSGPLQMSTSSGFAWAKRHNRSSSKCHGINPVDNTSAARHIRDNSDLKMHENEHGFSNSRSSSRGHDTSEVAKLAMHNYWSQIERPDSFDASDRYHSQELSLALFQKEEMSKRNNTDYQLDSGDKIEFSGPLLSQKHKVDEFLARHERQVRQTVRRSWFQKVKKSVK